MQRSVRNTSSFFFTLSSKRSLSSANSLSYKVENLSVYSVRLIVITADLPETEQTMTATYADDIVILASHHNSITASSNLQHHFHQFDTWLKRWLIKANENKSIHITFFLKRETCSAVILNGQHIPQRETAKYLGIYLDRRLKWQKHNFTKRKQLGLQLHRMYWIIGRKSKLTLENKLLTNKTILKPIWTYDFLLWGTASNSNIEILQRFQNKVIRSIVNAPWYVPNTILDTDLHIPTVKAEITNFTTKYREKLITGPNELIIALLDEEEPRRLKRFKPTELSTRLS